MLFNLNVQQFPQRHVYLYSALSYEFHYEFSNTIKPLQAQIFSRVFIITRKVYDVLFYTRHKLLPIKNEN